MGFDLTTFVFELVNFGFLIWILQRVLYRPLRLGIEKRRNELAAEHERASAEQRDAHALREEASRRLAEIEKVREAIITDAREQAAKEEARILEQARQDAAVERERVQRTLDRERGEALAWMREATVDSAVEIAGRLLKDLLPELADDVLLEALVASLAGYDERLLKESIEASGRDGRLTVELTMPSAPSQERLENLRSALSKRIGSPYEFVVREDESLMVGPVLRIGDQVLDASLAGHLGVLRDRARALARDGADDG